MRGADCSFASFVTERIDEDLRDQAGIDIQTYDAMLHTKEAGGRMTDLADRVLLGVGAVP